MALPPARTELADTYPNPSNAVHRVGMGKFLDYVTGLLGASGTAEDARTALGAASSGANSDITSLTALASINSGQLAGTRNRIINGAFQTNQRSYVSGAAVGAALYAHDRWKMAASADTYTFSTTANKTTITIPSGKVLRQVIEGLNLQTGTYTLSWEGTAQGKIGAGSYGASGITGAITGGTDTTIEFGAGTLANVQLEFGTTATQFEQRSIGLELSLCQRYFEVLGYRIDTAVANGTINSANLKYLVLKRSTPSLVKLGESLSNTTFNSYQMATTTGVSICMNATGVVGITTGTLTISAEL